MNESRKREHPDNVYCILKRVIESKRRKLTESAEHSQEESISTDQPISEQLEEPSAEQFTEQRSESFERFDCECDIHNRINNWRKVGLEPHFRITDIVCWMDPNPNNSKDPAFLEREKELTRPISLTYDLRNITRQEYIKYIRFYGIRGRYATLMADRAVLWGILKPERE